eukprot:1160398-Pelagomonas_calceolata.AAC.1
MCCKTDLMCCKTDLGSSSTQTTLGAGGGEEEVAAMVAAELPRRTIDHLALLLGKPHVSKRVIYPLAACGCILRPD